MTIMKKWLPILLATMMLAVPTAADAKTKALSDTFAEALKKGKLPYAKARIGHTKAYVMKKETDYYLDDNQLTSEKSKVTYEFDLVDGDYVAMTSKIRMMYRHYNADYTVSSVKKKLGKPVKIVYGKKHQTYRALYKVGKYHVFVHTLYNNVKKENYTIVTIGKPNIVRWY